MQTRTARKSSPTRFVQRWEASCQHELAPRGERRADGRAAMTAARQRAKSENRLLVGEADLDVALLEHSAKMAEILKHAGVLLEQCRDDVDAVLSV